MTNDLISREKAKEAVKYIPWCDWSVVGRTLDELEVVDAAPVVHGRWIQNKTVPSYHFCSNCKKAHNMPKSCNVYVLPFYCPDCGAKMDEQTSGGG